MRSICLLFAVLGALSLASCAGFSQDGGFDAVANAARSHLDMDVKWPRTPEEQRKVERQVSELMARPLAAVDAVQIAVLNNRKLRGAFQELGISEADLVQSGRLPNPRFELRHASKAGLYDVEETLSFNVLALLTMPKSLEIEKGRFAQTQQTVVLQIAQLAGETRRAWIMAVAARQSVEYLQRARTAAETGAQLAQRMVAAGNWNSLDEAREQGFYAHATMKLTLAQLAADAARERLLSLLGLPGDVPVTRSGERPPLQLAERLPELPQRIDELPDVERAVLQDRIDLRLMRMHLDELAQNLKLTKATRFVNVLDAGATRVQQGARQDPYETGFVLALEVPIFDSGRARIKNSEAIYLQAVDRFAQAAIEARSELRQAYANYRTAFDLARQQRDEVVPLYQSLARESLLRYNASLISVFELLAGAREQIASVDGYIQSLRDFWIAKSDLDGALLGNSSL
jgi:outer membrane protein TolC